MAEGKVGYHFAAIPDWVLEHSGLDGNAVRVFGLMARFTKSFPSLPWLAERCGCSEQTIRRAVRSLQDAGAVLVTPRFDEEGRQTSNLYELAGDRPFQASDRDPSTGDRAGVSPVVPDLDKSDLDKNDSTLARKTRRTRKAKADPDDPIPTTARRIVDAVIAQRKAEGKPKPMVGFVQVNDVRALLRNGHSEADVLWAALNAATIRAGAMEIALANRTPVKVIDGGLPENVRPEPGKSRILTADEVRAIAIGSDIGKP